MAELPELRSDPLPQQLPTPGQMYGHPHAFGVARDLERIKQGFVPPPRVPRIKTRDRRVRGGPWASFRRWWAGSDKRPVDFWHRMRCRTGHHEMRGGHQMQFGSRFEFVERRCIWCDATPAL